jgi:CRP-like cAMP-binding protein
MFASHSPLQNRLLAALPAAVRERLFPCLEPVPMSSGDVLYQSGAPMRHVYFPTTAIVSLLYVMENGACGETAMVGNEGVLGIALFLGNETTPSRAVVENTGFGYRLETRLLLAEFNQAGTVMQLLLHYAQALLTQMAQTAFCNHHHTLDQQFCRRLLLCTDRLHSNEMAMTQEWISSMVGVRREGVTELTGKLQRAGLIHTCHDRLTVLDRPALERRACECYAVVRDTFERLLPHHMTRTAQPLAPQRFVHPEASDWYLPAPGHAAARKRQ